jgi:hypothetical protein
VRKRLTQLSARTGELLDEILYGRIRAIEEYLADRPIPYTLTPEAEALLAGIAPEITQ